MKTTLVIADDHPLISSATKTIIEQFPNYKVLYEVENGQVLIDKFQSGETIPDIVLLDLSMPIMDGKETSIWLKKNYPNVKVLINTVQIDINSFISMFEAGVLGFITKNARPKNLLNCLNLIIQNIPCYPDWTESTLNSLYPFSTVSKEIFSEEELIYLNQLCQYQSKQNIAINLNTTIEKVEQFERILYLKLNVHSKNALIYFARKNNLID